jgi:cell division protein FtsB
MERRNLRSHNDNDCPLTIVHCEFKDIGCEVKLPRKSLSKHLEEGVVAHMLLQTKRLMELKEENKQLKQQIEKLNKDLSK